jgi:integrase
VRFVVATVDAPARDGEALRRYLNDALRPDSGETDPIIERWLALHSLELRQLTRARCVAVEQALGLGLRGQPLSASTAARFRKVAHACIKAAVHFDLLASDPWPPRTRGRAQRKAARVSKKVNAAALPDPATMARAIEAIVTHQPGSHKYRVMTAVAYYAGLRPSEVVMLRRDALTLPDEGWGSIDVREADVDFDEPGEPKTGQRPVPIPPVLVGMLRESIDDQPELAPGDLIFRTRNDKRPTQSNWGRAWRRALIAVGHRPLRVYDCRHAAATTWLRAGVPLAEVARRLGHSVETLVSTYVGALPDDEQVGNQRIEAALTAGDISSAPSSAVPSARLAALPTIHRPRSGRTGEGGTT